MATWSIHKPDYFDELFKKYEDSYKKDPISIFPTEIACSEDKGEQDHSDNEDEEITMSTYERKVKKPDTNRGVAIKKSIFAHCDGFKNEAEMDIAEFPSRGYCVDSTFLMKNLCKYSSPVTVAYPGAVVLPLREPVFSRIEDITANACDFSSLYPKTMELWNICKTTAAFNPNYAVMVDGEFYDPFDESKFNIAAVPFEFNRQYVNVCVILVKPEFKQSAMTNFIRNIINLRTQTKAEQKKAQTLGLIVEYLRLENRQKAYKLVINTTYGAMFTKTFTIFQPYLCSSVTFYGRIALLRFMLTIYYYYALKNIDASGLKRGPVAGDTDSLFIKSTVEETKEFIKLFESWPANRGVYIIEHENIVDDMIFFARKRYVFHFRNGPRITSKGTFVKKQSEGCKSFLHYFLLLLFSKYLSERQLVEFRNCLRKLLIDLFEESKTNMSHAFTLSQDLAAYKNPSCLHMQLKHLENLTGKSYVAGTLVKYAHYPFVFIPGPYYGPLDPTNRGQANFIKGKHNCTALVEDFEPFYAGAGLKKSVVRGIELDLKATLTSIFQSVADKEGNTTLKQIFCEEFQQVFSTNLFDFQINSPVINRKRKLTKQESNLLTTGFTACAQSIKNYFAKKSTY